MVAKKIDMSLPTVECVRKKDVPPARVVPPDVREARCTACGATVYVAPSTRRMIAAGVCRPVCRQCVPAEAVIGVMTAEQVADLAAYAAAGGEP